MNTETTTATKTPSRITITYFPRDGARGFIAYARFKGNEMAGAQVHLAKVVARETTKTAVRLVVDGKIVWSGYGTRTK